jgi:hypothetical protein
VGFFFFVTAQLGNQPGEKFGLFAWLSSGVIGLASESFFWVWFAAGMNGIAADLLGLKPAPSEAGKYPHP